MRPSQVVPLAADSDHFHPLQEAAILGEILPDSFGTFASFP